MPISALDKTRAQFAEPISRRDLSSVSRDREIRIVQTATPITDASWERLNAELFSRRPDIELRVYGFYWNDCDLSFARRMTHVRHFAADSLQEASNVEAVAEMPQLESLGLGIFNLESFGVLDQVSPGLSRLFLGATRSKRPSLAPLGRFSELRELSLDGQQKHIEVLAELRRLQDLTLRSISTPGLEYLSGLPELWSLDVKLGGIRDLSAASEIESLKYLELWQVRGLEDVSVISELSALQNLFLQNLPRVASLPPLERNRDLRRIVLQNLRGLRDLSTLQSAPALEEFLLLQGEALQPEDLAPVLRNPSLVSVGAFFGSDKRNRTFEAMTDASGKERFEWSPFAYR